MGNLRSVLIILLTFVVAHWLRFGWYPINSAYLQVALIGLLLTAIILPATGAFRVEFRWEFARQIRRLTAGWSMVVMMMVVLAAILKVSSDFSRIWFGYWVILGALGLTLGQLFSHLWSVQRQKEAAHCEMLSWLELVKRQQGLMIVCAVKPAAE